MEENNKNEQGPKNPSLKPDPETLHTTDPQENMEGPVSSLMHNAGEAFETDETKREADEKKERNT
jgi:hypothetical protein